MGKTILLLTSRYKENASANGICTISIMRALEKMSHQVFIIGIGDEEVSSRKEYIIKHSDSNNNRKKTIEYIHAIKRIFKPRYSKALARKYIKKAINIIECNNVDTVVAVYYPLETIVALETIKRRFQNIKCISYELDSATDGIHSGGRGDSLFDKAYIRWMNKFYRSIDQIFIMESHRKHFYECYSKWIEKVEYVDIPVLTEPEFSPKKDINSDGVSFFYTGVLDKNYRSPLRPLNCLAGLSKQNNWQIHFYSRGNCEDILNEWSKKNNCICQHGYVTQEILNRELSGADFLLSIGNANSNSLPSKLISYFALGKPIIHFSLQKDDVCVNYLKRYPLALTIGIDEEIELAVKRIEVFVSVHLNDVVPFEKVKTFYKKNTPEYSAAKLIEE